MVKPVEKSIYSQHFENITYEHIVGAATELERPFEKLRTKHDLSILKKYLIPGNVLDFPIGTGRVYPSLIGEYEDYGKDIAPPYVTYAQEQYPDIADHFSEGSFEDPGGPKDFFNNIYSLRVLNNVHDLNLAIANTSKLLKPGGIWMFNLPPKRVTDDLIHTLKVNGLELQDCVSYDWVSSVKEMGRIEAGIRSRFISLIKRGLMPYFLYKLVDRIMPRKGLSMLVVKKK